MKARHLVLALLTSILSLILAAGCAQPNKQLWYGTWTSPTGPYQRVVRNPDGTVDYFALQSDTAPLSRSRVQIVKCWLDSSGNTWFNTQVTILEGPFKNTVGKLQTLEKIDKSGNVLEVMDTGVAEFSPKGFPTKIDPNQKDAYLHKSYVRASQ